MASALELEVEKMQAQPDELKPLIEGMHDIESLHAVTEETTVAAQKAIRAFESRTTLLTAAIQANRALLAHGWPWIPEFDVSATVLADIEANKKTINLAAGRFKAKPPVAQLGQNPFTEAVPKT
jgi:hypothetical protein